MSALNPLKKPAEIFLPAFFYLLWGNPSYAMTT